ncbi:MAG: Smr/MutS family protein [Alphaproteobacteria bacterium]|nr:Smr/MutS family protein [Alphaproteobacteria bacterium]
MSRRQTTKEERELFHAVAKGAALAPAAVSAAKPKPKPKAKTAGGVDAGTARKLARGELDADAKLDLHGLSEAAAHRALANFVQNAHRRGARLLLIVTGKGARDPDAPFDLEFAGRSRGVLKTMVPRWLDEPPLAGSIVLKRPAHRRHGGDGALYVYLRKR